MHSWAKINHWYIDKSFNRIYIGWQFMIILHRTLSLDSHSHATRFFANDKIFYILHILCFWDKLYMILLNLLVSMNISECPRSIVINIMKAILRIWGERYPIFLIKSGISFSLTVTHDQTIWIIVYRIINSNTPSETLPSQSFIYCYYY